MNSKIKTIANRFLWLSVDCSSLAVFRISFGAILFIECCRYFAHGWIADYEQPKFFFKYFGFEWVQAWPGHGMHYHFYILSVACLLFMLGAFYRVAATLVFIGFTYVFLLDETFYLNHIYLVCLISFLMIFAPANRLWSVDALLRPKIRRAFVPVWSLTMIRFQMALVYAYAGVAKLDGDWLSGRSIDHLIPQKPGFEALRNFALDPLVSQGIVIAGLLFDLSIVPLLLCRRTRVTGFILATAFHVTNSFLFQIGIFPWMAIAVTVLFFDADWPRQVYAWAASRIGWKVGPKPATSSRLTVAPKMRIYIATFAAVYLALQLAIPLRHWLYPGMTDWTDQGHRFSWRMMLRNRSGKATFWVEDKNMGTREKVHLKLFLTRSQITVMSKTPDMILQFAHFIKADMAARGHPHCEVHVEDLVSLNGRSPQPLIDPKVDLASQPRNLWPAHWILPLADE